mmetsp:Transcript_2972/g.8716  ORF Transcript_2972/g.8716 Transcript_2972/m.8716 type:complete len:332 (-) Transcript_2972:206-1201(-)
MLHVLHAGGLVVVLGLRVQGNVTDGIHIRVAGLQLAVHLDAAGPVVQEVHLALEQLGAGLGAHSHHHERALQLRAIIQHRCRHLAVLALKGLGTLALDDLDALVGIVLLVEPGDLGRKQARHEEWVGEHHRDVQPVLFQSAGHLHSNVATAHHHHLAASLLAVGHRSHDLVCVPDVAQGEDVVQVRAFRLEVLVQVDHPAAGGQHQLLELDGVTAVGDQLLANHVDLLHNRAGLEVNALLLVPLGRLLVATTAHAGVEAWQPGGTFGIQVGLGKGRALVRNDGLLAHNGQVALLHTLCNRLLCEVPGGVTSAQHNILVGAGSCHSGQSARS